MSVGEKKYWTEKYCWGFQFSKSLGEIFSEHVSYFSDNMLRLRFDVAFLNGTQKSELLPKTLRSLSTDMSNLFDSGEDSDISIVCASAVFPVHKCIISGN